MNFAKNPEINVDNSTPTPDNYYYRVGYIKEKTPDGVSHRFRVFEDPPRCAAHQ